MRSVLTLILLVISLAPFARAESVVLKDGSTVTGEFQRLLDGNVIFKTNSMGTLTIPVANIAGFTSASTVMVLLKDGKKSDGIFSVSASGAWQLQSANATGFFR